MLLGTVASFGLALVKVAAFTALYRDNDTVSGLNYQHIVTWSVLSSVLYGYMLTPWAYEYPRSIREGTVVADFLRPVNPFAFHVVRELGRYGALTLVRVLPVVVVMYLLLPIPTMSHPVALVMSFTLFVFGSIAFLYLIGASAFFGSEWGLWYSIGFYSSSLLGGVLVPVEFFPGFVRDLLLHSHVMALVASPTRIMNGIDVTETLVTQACWTIALLALSAQLMRIGRKYLVSYGG